MAKEKELDLLIDAELERIEAEEDEYVIDSHLAFHFVPSGFSVFLNISLDVSAQRIFNDRERESRKKSGDIMDTLEEAKRRTKKRIDNHQERYMRHYGIDPYIPTQYDLSIETEHYAPEDIATAVEEAFRAWLNE